MELRQLKYFLSAIRHGSVGAAADEHYVTQPAVSIQLKKLEEELGEKLFSRRGRRIVPTPAGQIVVSQGEEVMKRLASLAGSVRELTGMQRGELRIGTIDAASIYVLPRVFRSFRSAYPGIDINVEVAESARLVGDLTAGKIELAIVTLPLKGDAFEMMPIYEDRMVLVVHPRHALAGIKKRVLKAVAETGLITYPAHSTTRGIIEDVFRRNGLPLRAAMEVTSPEAIKRLTEAGLGASVLPLPLVAGEIRRGALRRLPTGSVRFVRILGMIHRKQDVLSPPARTFLDIVIGKMDVRSKRRIRTGREE
ncbi:MAG: LysR family transcriptional regulator [Chitinivibrionia bacterium]|nr:LysR family transcriptional regulator [Chitinivibrionia bacterium]